LKKCKKKENTWKIKTSKLKKRKQNERGKKERQKGKKMGKNDLSICIFFLHLFCFFDLLCFFCFYICQNKAKQKKKQIEKAK
jgi:hypothetical protein